MKRITKLNKILSLILALVMVFAFSIPAFAGGGQGTGNQDNPTMAGNGSSGFQLGFHDPYIDMSAAHGYDGTQVGKETAYFDIENEIFDSREDISFTIGLNPCGGQKNFNDVDFSGMYIYSTADADKIPVVTYVKGESDCPITVSELKRVSTEECPYSVSNERHAVITIKGNTLDMDGRYRLVIPGTSQSSNGKKLGVTLEVTFDTGVRSSEPEKLYDGTYLLRTSGEFDWFANALNEKTIPLNSNVKLMNSIDLSYNKTFIGRFTENNGYKRRYTGTFDGNGYTLTLNIFNMSSSGFATSGVFNYLGEGAVVKNLTVDGKVSTGDDYGVCSHVGGIVAFADGSVTIKNCVNNAEVYAPCASYVGGIIGSGNDITIVDCVNNGRVTGYRNVGGIIGELVFMNNKVSLIKNCVNYGDLVSPDKLLVLYGEDGISDGYHIWSDSIGGIVGSTYVLAPLSENPDRTGIVTNCVNYGNIYTPVSAGGIIGEGTYGGPKTVENCYNAGDIIFSRTDSLYKNDYRVIIGGIAGQLNGKLLYSYNSGKITMLTTPKENYIGAVYATRTSDTFANNAFALEGTYSTLSSNGETANMKFLTPDELKTDSTLLKDGRFISDSTSENPLNDGYPILPFQTKAESVEIADDKLDITEGDKVMLDLKKSPEGSIVGTLEWTSSDETVATVENGVVTTLKQGTTIITLKDPVTGSEDTIEIKVTCNHDIISVVTKKATCEEDGFENLSCSKCDYKLDGSPIPKTGHNISDWKYDDEKHYKVCLNEGCTVVFEEGKHESGPKHAATSTKKATCRVCGAEYGDLLPTGWVQDGADYYYYDSDGKLVTGWTEIDGSHYYLDPEKDGKMITGWQQIGGNWYYFNQWGKMVTGWIQISGKWYYFNQWGKMVTGWVQISGKWYYFNSSGAMLTGWQQLSGKWYYFNSSGAMLTGWQQIGGKWYYFNSSGVMLTGTQRINGKYYRFNSSGVWVA